jgi:hypothetical protein
MKIFNCDITALHSYAKKDDELIANHVSALVPKIISHLTGTICLLLKTFEDQEAAEERKAWEADRDELLEVLRFYYNKAVELGISTHSFKGLDVRDFTDAALAREEWGKLVEEHGLGKCNVQDVKVAGSPTITRIMVLNT